MTTTVSTPVPDRVLALDEAHDPSTCGSKAAALGALRRAGHRVPDGVVVPAGVPFTIAEALAARDRLGPGPWAVRSSSVAEDLGDASFAGQYETVLNVTTPDGVVDAVARVRNSAWTAHVADYRRAQAGDARASMAVLVQRQIAARAAGIAFSANPATGADEVVIEAVSGLGDRLASGDADAERWVDIGGTANPVGAARTINQGLAERLAALARRIAVERGSAQDVEWAYDGAELYLLQARAITGLPKAPVFEVPPGRWVKDAHHWTGPMTPVGASILLPVLEQAFAQFLPEFGFPLEAIRARSFGGEVYTQEIEPGGRHNPGVPPPWWVGAVAFRVVPPLRRLARAAEAALPKLEAYPREWETSWRADCRRRIDEARAVDLDALDDEALLRHLRHVIDQVALPGLVIHFRLMMPDVVALHDLACCCEAGLGWTPAQTLELLAGLSDTVTRPAVEMAAIAALAGPKAVAQGLAGVRASAAAARLDEWLATWGARSIDLDPGAPTVAEHETTLLALLRQPPPDADGRRRMREAAVARARAALNQTDRVRFDRALAVAERLHPMREENVLYTQSLPIGLLRRTLLEFGRRLVARGVLRRADDVAYLDVAEIGPSLEGRLAGEPAADRVSRRQAEHRWVRANPGPAYYGPAPVPMPSTRGLPAAMQRLLGAFAWHLALEETGKPPAAPRGVLAGVGASPGRVTGRVRVVRREADLSALELGEVLVCPSTHSSWSVAFARAAALVTDHGGMLAHPAIVAREYGIPAVVGTGIATSTLVDGQTVTVDGTAGRVDVHPSL
jgi:rifampicin phosphotransferase